MEPKHSMGLPYTPISWGGLGRHTGRHIWQSQTGRVWEDVSSLIGSQSVDGHIRGGPWCPNCSIIHPGPLVCDRPVDTRRQSPSRSRPTAMEVKGCVFKAWPCILLLGKQKIPRIPTGIDSMGFTKQPCGFRTVLDYKTKSTLKPQKLHVTSRQP